MMLQRRRRKTFIHLARIIFVFFAGLAVAAGIALSQLDVNSLKSDVAAVLESAAGMPVEINGELSWKLSLRPEIRIVDVRIKNKPWAGHKYALAVPEMLVQLNLISILRGSPAIQSIKMLRPVANIEENGKGELSVDLRQAPREIKIPQAIRKSEYPFELDIGVGSIELEKPEFFFIAPSGVRTFAPDSLKISMHEKNGSMDFTGVVAESGAKYPFTLSFLKYDRSAEVYPVRVAIAGNVFPLAASVHLDSNKMPASLTLEGRIENLPALGESFGIFLPKIAPSNVNISASFGKKHIAVKKFSAKSKQSDFNISGKYDFAGEKPKIYLNVKSDNFNLDEFFTDLYKDGERRRVRPDRPLNVFRDIPLFGEILPKLDAELDINVRRLAVYMDMSIQNIVAGANAKDGIAVVSTNSDFMGGNVRTKLRVRADDDGTLHARAAGIGRGVIVGDILASVGERNFISDLPANFDFYMRASGRELADVVKTATGLARVSSNAGGYAHEEMVELLYGRDFLTSVKESVEGMFRGRKKNSQMRIYCAAANLKIRNGRVEMDKNAAVQTRIVNMRMTGGVDFGNERMDVALHTTPVDGLKLSISGNFVNSIRFTGSLAEPELKLNGDAVSRKIAATGVGLAVGALTGGMGLLVGAGVGLVGSEMLDNWTADDSPCRTVMKSGAPVSEKNDPAFMSQPVDKLAEHFINE
jgi:uncharacterized protein involved in outer membrane biogenesis